VNAQSWALPFALSSYAGGESRLQAGSGGMQLDFVLVSLFFVIVVIVIAVAIARGVSGRSRIQRPLSETTSFPPPPPPDTVMVKCEYCGTEQTWRETCAQCGAPLPKPKIV